LLTEQGNGHALDSIQLSIVRELTLNIAASVCCVIRSGLLVETRGSHRWARSFFELIATMDISGTSSSTRGLRRATPLPRFSSHRRRNASSDHDMNTHYVGAIWMPFWSCIVFSLIDE
jgi:hypothetical protein